MNFNSPQYLFFLPVVALVFAYRFFQWMIRQPEGDAQMVAIAEHVREGARAYLTRQYKIVFIFFLVF